MAEYCSREIDLRLNQPIMPPHQGYRFLTGVPFDFSRHNDQPIIHSKIVTLKKKPIEVVVTELKVTSRSVARLVDCLIEEYTKCGPVSYRDEITDRNLDHLEPRTSTTAYNILTRGLIY